MIPMIWYSRKAKTMEVIKRSVIAQELEGRSNELSVHRVFLESENICMIQ